MQRCQIWTQTLFVMRMIEGVLLVLWDSLGCWLTNNTPQYTRKTSSLEKWRGRWKSIEPLTRRIENGWKANNFCAALWENRQHKAYSVEEAAALAKKPPFAKFDATVEAVLQLEHRLLKADQQTAWEQWYCQTVPVRPRVLCFRTWCKSWRSKSRWCRFCYEDDLALNKINDGWLTRRLSPLRHDGLLLDLDVSWPRNPDAKPQKLVL